MPLVPTYDKGIRSMLETKWYVIEGTAIMHYVNAQMERMYKEFNTRHEISSSDTVGQKCDLII